MPTPEAVIALTLYSRPGCHLCDEMKAMVRRVTNLTTLNGGTPIAIDEIDISTDPVLERQYGVEIPVLLVNGKKVAKYRITEDALRRTLETAGGA